MSSPPIYFLDACVPMYAAGGEHRYKEPCARLVMAVSEGEIQAVTDVEVVQEIMYRFHGIRQHAVGLRLADSFLALMENVLPVTRQDVHRSLELQRKYAFLPPRDALHVAVMLGEGVRQIVTADRHFDRVKEVERVDPADVQC